MRLQGKDVYLAVLERGDCRTVWKNYEYDYEHPAEELNIGHSEEKADAWFDDIQKRQGKTHIRLGVFLNDGTVIGDVALQDIDWKNRSCSVGMGIAKIEHRSKGYGQQAVRLMLEHGFFRIGLERITANTLEVNIGAQKSLEKCGFVLEGRERKAVYLNGQRWDKLRYAVLREEFQ